MQEKKDKKIKKSILLNIFQLVIIMIQTTYMIILKVAEQGNEIPSLSNVCYECPNPLEDSESIAVKCGFYFREGKVYVYRGYGYFEYTGTALIKNLPGDSFEVNGRLITTEEGYEWRIVDEETLELLNIPLRTNQNYIALKEGTLYKRSLADLRRIIRRDQWNTQRAY